MYLKKKTYNVVQQMAGIKSKFPNFEVKTNREVLTALGQIRPTARSCSYQVKIKYSLGQAPLITVISPNLQRNHKGEEIPHMYSQVSLCLYRPKYGEFKSTDLISNTIIPWTSLWLYHYEIWHVTGKWHGGGEHPLKAVA